MQVALWLRELGLARYASAFERHEITREVLAQLSPEDLTDLGVVLPAHRRKILRAIAELKQGTQASAEQVAERPGLGTKVPEIPEESLGVSGVTERRQITVMFCDFVGSTELSARLDPEDLREIISSFHSAVSRTVASFGGFVAEYMGDGVLVYFGWPQAHETDTEQAISAGGEVIRAIANLEFKTEKCSVRIGVATGLVVVGDVTSRPGEVKSPAAMGQTPNLAARLQSLAQPNTIVIDQATRVRIGNLFTYKTLETNELKGFPGSVQAWQVVGKSSVQSRFEALHGSTPTPLTGRDEELEFLLRRWRQVGANDGRVVLVSGEPGIGKSRLLAELQERLRGSPIITLRYFCSAYHQESPLHPIISQFSYAAGFHPDDSTLDRVAKLRKILVATGTSEQDLALFADFLSIRGNGITPVNFSPQRKKELLFAALIRQVERLAENSPILMLFEDLHWCDHTTCELLDLLIERLREVSVLLVLTFRPEFHAPWIGRAGVAGVTLSRLDRRQAAAMVAHVASTAMLSSDLLTRIASQADGIPLFIEELTKTVLERGLERIEGAQLSVPDTLQASLMARLDRFPTAKQVAQIGSVIGREFRQNLLAAVAPLSADKLAEGLDQLVASGLMFRRGEPPDALYTFKHALVQDTAYESLLRSHRSAAHASIVKAILELTPETEDTQPEMLGTHCARAGLFEKAVAYFLRAAQRAAERSAMAEARGHVARGLELSESIADEAQGRLRRAELQLVLCNAEMATHGYGAAEHGSAAAKAVALCRALSSDIAARTKLAARALFHDWLFNAHVGDLNRGHSIAKELMELAYDRGDLEMRMFAATAYGANCNFLGRLPEARSVFQAALTESEHEKHDEIAAQFGVDAEVVVRGSFSRVLACLGLLGESLKQAEASLERARRLDHRPSLAVSLVATLDASWVMHDMERVRQRSGALVALAAEQGFSFWLARAKCHAGWIAAHEGRLDTGQSLLREGLAAMRDAGVVVYNPLAHAMLADVEVSFGHSMKALEVLEEGLSISARSGGIWCDCELIRKKGELLTEGVAAQEELFRQAIETARRSSLKVFELRAACNLARSLARRGLRDAARKLLRPIYDSFTDAVEAPDIRGAAAFLNEL
jgi:class 3 adenylate cyclase/tetratricopeptide (TPR) repeat protein